ncbi:hypothetical protein KAR34_09335 [bacterium]|nr:hypothetical protein [bacterium]
MKKMLFLTLLVVFVLPTLSWGDKITTKTSQDKTYIFAHYMTWFKTPEISGHWTHWSWGKKPHKHDPDRTLQSGKKDIASIYYPAIGPYDSSDEDVIEYHILLAKAAGIDGFVINWYGFRDENDNLRHEDQSFKKLLKISEKLGFLVCIDIDDKCMFPPFKRVKKRSESIDLAKQAISGICTEYADRPAYFRMQGRPVITNFGWGPPFYAFNNAVSFSPEEWGEILKHVSPYNMLFIANYQWHWGKSIEQTGFLKIADSIYPWVSGGPEMREKFYQQSQKALQQKKISFISGQACPGFDSYGTWGWGHGRSIIDRKDGQTYETTWKESLKNQAKWIQLITWNDFAEGSTIEPTKEYGTKYLAITAKYAKQVGNQHVSISALDLPRAIYTLKKNVKKSQTKKLSKTESRKLVKINTALEDAVSAFAAGKYKPAKKLVASSELKMKSFSPKLKKQAQVKIKLAPNKVVFKSGEQTTLTVTLHNPTANTVAGTLVFDSDDDIPAEWFNQAEWPVSIGAGKTQSQDVKIYVPKQAGRVDALLEARFKTKQGDVLKSRVVDVSVKSVSLHADIGDKYILTPNKPGKVIVRLLTNEHAMASGNITLAVPAGWKVSPEKQTYKVVGTDIKEYVFTVTSAPSKSVEIITVRISSKSGDEISIFQPFRALAGKEAVMFEADVNSDGIKDVVLGNKAIEVHVSAGLGGRILAYYSRATGSNQLYLDYPSLENMSPNFSQDWIEYGGINDTYPAWPGEVWNNEWSFAIKKKGSERVLEMTTTTENQLLLERNIVLDDENPVLKVIYTVTNKSKQDARFTWENHPDLSPGPAAASHGKHTIVVPTKEGVIQEVFKPSLTKSYYTPSENWCVAWDKGSGEYFAQRFDLDMAKQIGAWKGKTFFTVEVISKAIELRPGEKKVFKLEYRIGKQDWQKALGVKMK